jgi:hypothetical protein
MAENLRGINEFPYYKTIAVDTSTTEIILPSEARFITIGSETLTVYVTQNGATDGGIVPTNRIFIPSNNVLPIRLGTGLQRKNIFISAKTGSGNVNIQLEE